MTSLSYLNRLLQEALSLFKNRIGLSEGLIARQIDSRHCVLHKGCCTEREGLTPTGWQPNWMSLQVHCCFMPICLYVCFVEQHCAVIECPVNAVFSY